MPWSPMQWLRRPQQLQPLTEAELIQQCRRICALHEARLYGQAPRASNPWAAERLYETIEGRPFNNQAPWTNTDKQRQLWLQVRRSVSGDRDSSEVLRERAEAEQKELGKRLAVNPPTFLLETLGPYPPRDVWRRDGNGKPVSFRDDWEQAAGAITALHIGAGISIDLPDKSLRSSAHYKAAWWGIETVRDESHALTVIARSNNAVLPSLNLGFWQ